MEVDLDNLEYPGQRNLFEFHLCLFYQMEIGVIPFLPTVASTSIVCDGKIIFWSSMTSKSFPNSK